MVIKGKFGVTRGFLERTPPFRSLALYPIELRALIFILIYLISNNNKTLKCYNVISFYMFKVILIFSFLVSLNLYGEKGPVTGYDIPRFVSLKSNEVNLRVGPSINYPINLKYTKKNLPIEIIDEFDVWRKIRDHENNIGWIKKGLLKGDRYVLTGLNNEDVKILNHPGGKQIGVIQKNNILILNKCLKNWCYIYHADIQGWATKNGIWGIYKKEIYNIKFYQPIINQYWKILNSRLLN